MNSKNAFVYMMVIFIVLVFLCPCQALAQGIKFRGVNIPYTIKCGDTVIEKGKYDIEVTMPETSGIRVFYFRISKKNKTLCMIPGTKVHYKSEAQSDLYKDPNIPDQPRIKMKSIKPLKKLYIYFESGKLHLYKFEKIRYELDFIE